MTEDEQVVDLSQVFEGFGEDYRFAGRKVLVTDNFGPRLRIKQEHAYGIGGQLWDAAYLLSKYLCLLYPSTMTDLRVLELGSGCGLPSILSCIKGATVTATDIFPPLRLTQDNFTLNQSLLAGTYSLHELDWTNAEQRNALSRPFDLVLMSDLFYMPVSPTQSLADSLLETLLSVVSTQTKVIMTYKFRVEHTITPFLNALATRFVITEKQEAMRTLFQHSRIHLCELTLS